MTKKEQEKLFVEKILKTGFEWYCVTYEHGNWYYCFQLKDHQVFFTNLSKEGCRQLGIDEDTGVER